jgi:hypothetical protein
MNSLLKINVLELPGSGGKIKLQISSEDKNLLIYFNNSSIK